MATEAQKRAIRKNDVEAIHGLRNALEVWECADDEWLGEPDDN